MKKSKTLFMLQLLHSHVALSLSSLAAAGTNASTVDLSAMEHSIVKTGAMNLLAVCMLLLHARPKPHP
jgi:hypothetical protein